MARPKREPSDVWRERLERLIRAQRWREEGDWSFQRALQERSLVDWFAEQRRLLAKGSLSGQRIADLDTFPEELGNWRALGPPPSKEKWRRPGRVTKSRQDHFGARAEELVAYGNAHGTLEVDPEINPGLARWVARHRQSIRWNRLSEQQQALLTTLGVEPKRSQWDRGLERLRDFRQRHGHARPSMQEDRDLHRWIGRQRAVFELGRMPKDHVRILVAMGVELSRPPRRRSR